MKKILFTVCSLAALIFSSCSNDSITIDKLAPKHTVTYNVGTQAMYDTFNHVEYIRDNYLREDTLCIGVTTYVYDSNGALVDQNVTTLKNFNNAQQTFKNLVEGNYTFVTIETLLNPIKNNKSSSWSFDDINSISTLKLTQISRPKRANLLGVSTDSVNVTSDASVNVTPKIIGSLITFHAYNFDKSPFVEVGFGSKDILNYYSLDPQLDRAARFNKNLTSSGYFNLRASMATSDASSYVVPTYVVESDIQVMNAAQNESDANSSTWSTWSPQSATLEDGKTYELGFYYLGASDDGRYSAATYLGDAAGLSTWKKENDEVWNSTTILFNEPYVTWGGSVSTVKSYMTDYKLGGDVTNDDNTYKVWYYGKNRESETDYYFESVTGGLLQALVFFNSENVGEDELLSTFNKMGYTFVDKTDSYSTYKKNSNVYVEIGLNDQNYWYVGYYKPGQSANRYSLNDYRAFSSKNLVSKHVINAGFSVNKLQSRLRSCEDALSMDIFK